MVSTWPTEDLCVLFLTDNENVPYSPAAHFLYPEFFPETSFLLLKQAQSAV